MSDSISSLSPGYLQSIVNTALQNAGLTSNKTTSVGVDASSFDAKPDNGQLSPFAQVMSTLQQLQQSDPAKYQQVTQQIATNLQKAAQTAQSNGNVTAANQLNQLADDFSKASNNGQLPNVQDLAQAMHGHHHHHPHAASADSNQSSNSDGSSTDANQALNQILSAFQTNTGQSDALNPTNIIMDTLSSAGISS
jgi:hypothetical protein